MPGRSAPAADLSEPRARGRRIALRIILWAAAVDGALLVALLFVLAFGDAAAARNLLTVFGFGYLYLVYLTATGAMRRRWGWWYAGLVAVTLGPVGAVVGARRLLRETPAVSPRAPGPTRKEQRKAAAEARRAGGR